jgi:hypothetical protein
MTTGAAVMHARHIGTPVFHLTENTFYSMAICIHLRGTSKRYVCQWQNLEEFT